MKIALIIFTRNEEKNSEKIFPKIPFKLFNNVYIVDGNSTDGTVRFWEKKKIKVFNQKYKGVGGAYESAFRNTKEDALVFFHPDGNMNPRDLEKFTTLINKGKGFIVASRTIKGAANEEDNQLFKFRKWSAQALCFFINILWGRNGNYATDLTQGYRAIRRDIYKKMHIKIPNAVAPDIEQIIRALKKDITITEFPTKENKRIYGDTAMPTFKTSVENIKVFFREFHDFK